MARTKIALGVALGTLFMSASAFAQSPPAPPVVAADGLPVVGDTPAAPPLPAGDIAVRTDVDHGLGAGIVVPKEPCGFIHHPCMYPHLALAVEGGVAIFNESGPFGFTTGVGAGTYPGASWGLRVGVELLRWLAIDAHYIGMDNHARANRAPVGAVGLFTNAATAELRFTLPIPYVQPYLFTGAGVYSTSVTGSTTARAASPYFGSTELGVPIGLGVAVQITNALSLGGELTYHRLFGESFATDDDVGGGDLTTFNLLLRGRI
jgi:hypothetical protein